MIDIGHEPSLDPPELTCGLPRCPICGAETENFYRRIDEWEIVGCDQCIEVVDEP